MKGSYSMIGKIKLSEIRANIVSAFDKAALSPDALMDQQISKATRGKRNQVEIETLMLVRGALQAGTGRKQRPRAHSD